MTNYIRDLGSWVAVIYFRSDRQVNMYDYNNVISQLLFLNLLAEASDEVGNNCDRWYDCLQSYQQYGGGVGRMSKIERIEWQKTERF